LALSAAKLNGFWHELLGFGAALLNPTYDLSSALHRRRGFSHERHQPHEFIAATAPPTGFIRSRQKLLSPRIPASQGFIFQAQKRATEVALFIT